MTIKDFYGKLGNYCLNISLFFIFLSLLAAVFFTYIGMDPWAGLIFTVFSLFYFIWYRFFKRKYDDSLITLKDHFEIADMPQFISESSPMGIYYFLPSGQLAYSIERKHSLKRRWVLFGSDGIREIEFEKRWGKARITILSGKKEIAVWNWNWGKRIGAVQVNGQTYLYRKKHPYQWNFYKNGVILAEIKKGILPIDWTEIFRLNRPYIVFHEAAERDIIECILIAYAFLEGV